MPAIRFLCQTLEFDNMDIHIKTLRDKQQYDEKYDEKEIEGLSSANWSIFGVLWPSSKVLAHIMQDYALEDKRILEVGGGIALSSLILNHRNADITVTDFNPEVKKFLDVNTKLNDDEDIPFICTNWINDDDKLGRFDLIIGSDILYEKFHLEDLSRFLDDHTNKDCKIILVDPGRGNHSKFSKLMISLGYSHSEYKPKNTDTYLDAPFKGQVIQYCK